MVLDVFLCTEANVMFIANKSHRSAIAAFVPRACIARPYTRRFPKFSIQKKPLTSRSAARNDNFQTY